MRAFRRLFCPVFALFFERKYSKFKWLILFFFFMKQVMPRHGAATPLEMQHRMP